MGVILDNMGAWFPIEKQIAELPGSIEMQMIGAPSLSDYSTNGTLSPISSSSSEDFEDLESGMPTVKQNKIPAVYMGLGM